MTRHTHPARARHAANLERLELLIVTTGFLLAMAAIGFVASLVA